MSYFKKLRDAVGEVVDSTAKITEYVIAGIVATFVRDLMHSSVNLETGFYLLFAFLLVMSGAYTFFRKGTAPLRTCPVEGCGEVFEMKDAMDFQKYEGHLWKSHYDPELEDLE